MIWTFHHIIVDGWCIAILIGDFTKFYNRLKAGENVKVIQKKLDSENLWEPQYKDYVELLQDKDEGMNYWENLLSGYDEMVEVKPIKELRGELEAKREKCIINPAETKVLIEAAKQQHVTVNTMVETALGILLARYNNVEDVVYGKIVSGRDVELKGIDSMVGLFINTIPVRVQCEKDKTSREILLEQQKQGTESITFSNCSLSKVQNLTRQKQDLIHVLFAYENYFIDEKNETEEKEEDVLDEPMNKIVIEEDCYFLGTYYT